GGGAGLSRIKNDNWISFDTTSGLPDNGVRGFLETDCSVLPKTRQAGAPAAPVSRNCFWVATDHGLGVLDHGEWQRFGRNTGLPDDSFRCFLHRHEADGRDSVWIGMTNGGIAILRNGTWSFLDTHSGLPANGVGVLVQDGDRVWAGTEGGVGLFEN